MIWIWLLTRNSDKWKWGTGPMDRYFAFLCAYCHASTAATVRTIGFGTGADPMAAEHAAHAAANAFAFHAVSAAACPRCCELQPLVQQGFAHAAVKLARRNKFRIPAAVVAALLVLAVLAVPAVSDLKHSVALAAGTLSASVAAGALFFAIFSGQVVTPSTNPSGVWFSHDPSQGPASWFPAQAGRTPFVAQPAPMLRVLSLIALGVTGLSALVALIVWGETFRTVYVVSSEGPSGSLSVRIDGTDKGKLTESASDDAPAMNLKVRTSSKHHVVVTDGKGRETAYEMDPAVADAGWVVAPHAQEHGLCLVSITSFYGIAPKEEKAELLGEDTELVALPHSFDHMFAETPATVQTKRGSSETRTSLRALDCDSLGEGKLVPFKVAPPRKETPPAADDSNGTDDSNEDEN